MASIKSAMEISTNEKATYHQETNIHFSFMNRCRKSVVLLHCHFNELKWQYIHVSQSQRGRLTKIQRN